MPAQTAAVPPPSHRPTMRMTSAAQMTAVPMKVSVGVWSGHGGGRCRVGMMKRWGIMAWSVSGGGLVNQFQEWRSVGWMKVGWAVGKGVGKMAWSVCGGWRSWRLLGRKYEGQCGVGWRWGRGWGRWPGQFVGGGGPEDYLEGSMKVNVGLDEGGEGGGEDGLVSLWGVEVLKITWKEVWRSMWGWMKVGKGVGKMAWSVCGGGGPEDYLEGSMKVNVGWMKVGKGVGKMAWSVCGGWRSWRLLGRKYEGQCGVDEGGEGDGEDGLVSLWGVEVLKITWKEVWRSMWGGWMPKVGVDEVGWR